eukprot:1149669-Pelagomonas_calceolata.AAC.3
MTAHVQACNTVLARIKRDQAALQSGSYTVTSCPICLEDFQMPPPAEEAPAPDPAEPSAPVRVYLKCLIVRLGGLCAGFNPTGGPSATVSMASPWISRIGFPICFLHSSWMTGQAPGELQATNPVEPSAPVKLAKNVEVARFSSAYKHFATAQCRVCVKVLPWSSVIQRPLLVHELVSALACSALEDSDISLCRPFGRGIVDSFGRDKQAFAGQVWAQMVAFFHSQGSEAVRAVEQLNACKEEAINN